MIVDASAVLALLSDAKSEPAFRNAVLVAPDLIIAETLNVCWKLARANHRVPERSVILSVLDTIQIEPSRPYAPRAAQIAGEIDHPVYDCLYLALAESRGDLLLTWDERFKRKLSRTAFTRHLL